MRENGARVTGEQAAAVLICEKRGRPLIRSDSSGAAGSLWAGLRPVRERGVAARSSVIGSKAQTGERQAGRGLLLLLGFLGRASARVGRVRRKGRGPNLQYGLQSTVKKFYGFPFFRIFFTNSLLI